MKTLLPMVFIAALLCGCPDSKLPKAPPKIPEPKAASPSPQGAQSMAPSYVPSYVSTHQRLAA